MIIGSKSQMLSGKKIALCITGSVAAVECVSIARLLMRHGADIFCVMSKNAQKLIHPNLMEWATGNPVVTELTGQIEHITLAGSHPSHVDLVLVAPSTANTIGKIAHGIDDTTVTTTVSSAIGAGIPILIVPAMHKSLYDHPIVLENIKKLEQIGITVMVPKMEESKAKIPDAESIVEKVIALLGPKDLGGYHFLVTAGPTRGWLDRVRFITNPSSGKMGIEIAREITSRGGKVTLVLGPTYVSPPSFVETIRVQSPQEMLEAVLRTMDSDKVDVLISAAAILDFVPIEQEDRKRPSGESFTVMFVPTKKVIEEVRKKHPELFIVGFKVESGVSDEELLKRAKEKIDAGICDIVVGNDEQRKGVAFGTDTNEVIIVGAEGLIEKVPLSPKREIARKIVDVIAKKILMGKMRSA